MDRTKAMHLIQRLLEHAESTSYPDEAARYLERAQELMVKHAIQEESLRARGVSREEVICGSVEIADRSPLANAKRALASAVATHMRCQTIVLQGQGSVAVVGVESDVRFVQSLYTSLLTQLMSSMERDATQARAEGALVDRTWRNSYAWGFVGRVDDRMAATNERIVHDWGAGSTDLVFAGRAKEVQDVVDDMFPSLTTSRARITIDQDGQTRGRSAGERADIAAGTRSMRPTPGLTR